ncbi:MAG: T9SS type A sorting domain-containing protein [Bacteroidetes bacterium]|nr:MAG: T9SS type A sorting domain-containing protein [Bacteroidota bacterium]
MRLPFIIIVICLFYVSGIYAQSDTLVVKLKDKTVKIDFSQIEKISFGKEAVISVRDNEANGFSIIGNSPNPFNEHTGIEFEIPSQGNVSVIIYNNTGEQIQKLECLNCRSGKNVLTWNCYDKNNCRVESGIYYYEVQFEQEVQTKKMLLVK